MESEHGGEDARARLSYYLLFRGSFPRYPPHGSRSHVSACECTRERRRNKDREAHRRILFGFRVRARACVFIRDDALRRTPSARPCIRVAKYTGFFLFPFYRSCHDSHACFSSSHARHSFRSPDLQCALFFPVCYTLSLSLFLRTNSSERETPLNSVIASRSVCRQNTFRTDKSISGDRSRPSRVRWVFQKNTSYRADSRGQHPAASAVSFPLRDHVHSYVIRAEECIALPAERLSAPPTNEVAVFTSRR